MPATIEDLEAAIQDTVSQANSVYLLNHNILEEYESRQKKVNPTFFIFFLLFPCFIYNMFVPR